MSRKGDFKQIVKRLRQLGYVVEIHGTGSVYDVETQDGTHVCKMSWASDPSVERRKVSAVLRKRGITL